MHVERKGRLVGQRLQPLVVDAGVDPFVEMWRGRIARVAWHWRGVAGDQVRCHELVSEFDMNLTLLLWQQAALRYINPLAAGDPRRFLPHDYLTIRALRGDRILRFTSFDDSGLGSAYSPWLDEATMATSAVASTDRRRRCHVRGFHLSIARGARSSHG
jgi:hypothetical protein